MLERKVLVGEFGGAVDVGGACAVTIQKVATLDHKVLDLVVKIERRQQNTARS